MKIKKRNGNLEQLSFDKIIYRLKKLCNDKTLGVLKKIDPDVVAQRVVSSIYDGVQSTELDEEAARIAVAMTENMEYQKLASRIVISNMHKSTIECFSEVMENLYNNTDKSGNPMPIIADDVIEIVRANKDALNFEIDYNRDYMFDYFGFKTLERSYLMKIWDQNSNEMRVVERPQHLYMRVAVGIHKDDIPSVIKTYHLISQHFYTHASPTLFNSSSRLSAFTSCYLLGTNDSIDGIFKTVSDCAKISKLGGGIGVHISNIRAKGSLIRGTNGLSDGIIPMIKVYNASAVYVNQCITPDTIVYAKDGFKRMDEITTSDYLITHDGTFKQVNEVIVNKKNELIYEINNCGSIDPLKCTKEHDIYVIRANMYKYPSMVKQSLQIGSIKPEFVPASEVKKDYYMGYPIPTYECDIPQFSNEQCRLYGIMLGDGSIIKNDTTARYQITLNNKSKLSTKAFVVDYLVRNNIHYWINNDCEICFTYNSKTIEKIGITEEMLYDKKKNKFMDTRFLHLPKEKAAMLMKGMMESDGCQTATGLWFTSTDKNLIYSMKYLCLRFGILTSCQTIDKVGQIMSYNKKGRPIISRKVAYQLRIPKLQILKDYKIKTDFTCQLKVNYFFEWNNILFTRIKRIEHINYSGDVYDFNMIDNHNYLTDMGLVHNSGRRKGSFALYCEPWHADILEFLELKKNQGHDDVRARDLFYAMWTPDLFMKQVESDGDWYLMCPDECPGLPEKYGEEFEELYWKYVEEKKYRKVVKAQEVWKKILEAQIETGVPYICYKDSVNKKCNQKNLGTIKSSNLCSEISLYSDDNQYACCNLSSIALPKFVEYENGKPYFNFEKLCEIAEYIITPMNKVIDNNYYPTPETAKSNFAHRPLGIGAQGLADVFFKMKLPFESKEAKQLNKEIFETIYYGCMKGSIELAKKDGAYSSFKGSPFSEGKFQFDLAQEYDGIKLDEYLSGRWDWEALRKELMEHGARNSMLVALMPTASTAQIMGNIESFEPIDSCIFKRRVLSGEFMVVNKHLVEDLNKLKLWNKEMKDTIIANNGSIQSIAEIPDELKEVYKTVWEISMKSVIEQCRDRGVFVDQMQSMNLFMANPTYKKLSSMHFYGWKNNLKTGCYYLRSKAIASAGKFSVDANLEKQIRKKKQKGEELKREEEVLLCSLDNPESCEMCSS
jgi:ribonucleoside-diphosphate reductase alpha chain